MRESQPADEFVEDIFSAEPPRHHFARVARDILTGPWRDPHEPMTTEGRGSIMTADMWIPVIGSVAGEIGESR